MEERIEYLLRQYLENKCTRKEFDEFFSYIRQSDDNEVIRELVRRAYETIGQSNASLTYVDEFGNLVLPQPDSFHLPKPEVKSHKKKITKPIMAMALVAVIIASGWLWNRTTTPVTATYNAGLLTKKVTERSEYKYLLLPDSTQVWLNAASSLEFPPQFAQDKREVYLSGEAYFDVKHADKLPFIIHTGKISTTVLGTAFNIKAYPGRKNIVVSVSRGKVRVNYADKEVAVLTKGQQVKVNNEDSRATEKKIDVSVAASWQQGNMVYDDETLADIAADLERVYDVHIRIQNTALKNLQVSTSFKREIGVEPALNILCRLTDAQLTLENGVFNIQ